MKIHKCGGVSICVSVSEEMRECDGVSVLFGE